MGVELPKTSREWVTSGLASTVASTDRLRRPWLSTARLAASVFLLGLAAAAVPSAALSPLAVLVAAGGASWAWARGEATRGGATVAAWAFSAAAAVAAAAPVVSAVAPTPTSSWTAGPLLLLVLPHAFLALGAAVAVSGRRAGAATPGAVADSLLLVLTVVAAALRWSVEPALAAPAGARADAVLRAAVEAIALLPVVPAALLVLRRRSLLPPRASVLLLAGSLFLMAATVAAVRGDALGPAAVGGAPALGLVGWVLLAGSGFAARRPAATARGMLIGRRMRDTLRRLMMPSAALFLGAVVVDFGMGPRPAAPTLVVLVALVAVLALRTAHAFSLVDRDVEQRQQLAQTQALVKVTHSLAGTTDLDETLRVISETARQVLGTRGAGIELVSEDGQELVTRSVVGLPPEILGLHFRVDGSFTGWVVRRGRARATIDPSKDPKIQPKSLAFLGRSPVAAAPIRFRGETLGALFACIRDDPFDAQELNLLGALAEQAAIAIQHARLFEQVTVLSVTDALTGLSNRRQLERELAREVAAARRGRPLVAVIFDLDDFKLYNDTYGHLAGDEALQAFAATLGGETRAMNFAARYGGDEFVALLSGTDVDGGRVFMARVREQFRNASARLGREPLTVSAGLATWSPEMERPDELLRRADAELYRAKARLRA